MGLQKQEVKLNSLEGHVFFDIIQDKVKGEYYETSIFFALVQLL